MTDQEEFDSLYITSSEIRDSLGVSRTGMFHAVERGDLPAPIIICRQDGAPYLFIWKRREAEPCIEQWRLKLVKRGRAA